MKISFFSPKVLTINRVFSCPKDSGLFPDITDCKKYYECNESKAIRKNCKTENTYWNTETLSCKPIETTNCDPNNTFRCPQSEGIFVDMLTCDHFYSCRRNKPSLHRCPKGSHFNIKDETCDLPQYAECELEPDLKLCANASDLIPDKRNCRCYFECDQELRPLPKCCEDGLLWNDWAQACDDALFVDCFNTRK